MGIVLALLVSEESSEERLLEVPAEVSPAMVELLLVRFE
jgi:hypothetical protein